MSRAKRAVLPLIVFFVAAVVGAWAGGLLSLPPALALVVAPFLLLWVGINVANGYQEGRAAGAGRLRSIVRGAWQAIWW